MGTVSLIGRKISNNDKQFFQKFTKARSKLEEILVAHKDLIATATQKHVSSRRVSKYADLLDGLINRINDGLSVSEADIVELADLNGKIVTGSSNHAPKEFSDDVKSQSFIYTALASSIRCPLCNGYLDTEKSVSYDHIVRAREGGMGHSTNCQLTHPYCNQSFKQ